MTEKTIHITFINVVDESILEETDFPAAELPEQFEPQIELQIGDSQWCVEEAIPAHSREFLQTGQLTLRLSRVEMMDPNEILFSLPTIAADLPATAEQSEYTAFDLVLHEDDWRQYEFLRKDQHAALDEELRGIANIWENHSSSIYEDGMASFNSIHLRRSIGEPALQLSLNALLAALSNPPFNVKQLGAVRIGSGRACVKNSFAIATLEGVLYGTLADDHSDVVNLLALYPMDDQTDEAAPEGEGMMYEPGLVDRIVQTFDLLFVNWCGCEVLPEN